MNLTGGRDLLPPAAPAHGYEVLADALLAHLDGPAFGLMGDANLAVVAALAARGARFVATRHESAAVAAATGHALATGRPAFVTTTRGPGTANAVTALTSAVRDRAPLVYLAGASPLVGPMNNQAIDQVALLAPTGARILRVEDGARLEAAVAQAFAAARAARIPVVLDIPSDLMHGPALAQVMPKVDGREAPGLPPTVPEMPVATSIAEAAGILLGATHPVILAGRGLGGGHAAATVRALGEATGALLATTLPMTGLFHGDPFAVPFAGGFTPAAVRALLDRADVVLVLGASLNRYTTAEDTLFRDARLLRVDLDPAVGERTRVGRGSMALTGDAVAVAEALLAEVKRAGPRRDPGARTDEARATIAASGHAQDVPVRHGAGGVDPRAALRALDAVLPADRRVVVDVGHFSIFPCQVLPARSAGDLIPAYGFASVGLALGTAIGVAAADPERAVLLVIGDGGLLMSLGELETVAREAPNLVIAVMNDAAYGAEVHHLARHGLDPSIAQFPPTDFAALAVALGFRGLPVRSEADLEAAAAVAGAVAGRGVHGPALIDVRINPEVVSERFALLRRSAGS